jgi:UDP-glucose 4-epimerase
LRFGNVYGPGSDQKSSVIAKFIKQAMGGETLEIYGDGRQTRDFIYIDDLIHAIRLAVDVDGMGGEIFQIGTNTEKTIHELVETLLSILAQSGFGNVRFHYGSPRRGDVRRNFSDTSKARSLLDWEAQVDLREGLTRTVKWFSESWCNPREDRKANVES